MRNIISRRTIAADACLVLLICACLADPAACEAPGQAAESKPAANAAPGDTTVDTGSLALAAVKKLSLAVAVATALDSNPRLRSAQKDYLNAISQTRIAGQRTAFSVGSSASLERTPDESTRSGRLFGDVTYRNMLGTQATLNVAPFGSGQDRGSIGFTLTHPLLRRRGVLSEKSDSLLSARSSALVSDRRLFLQRQATVQDVIEAYCRVVQANEQVKVEEEALAIAVKTAEIAVKREAAGLDRGLDVVRAETTVEQMRDDLNLRVQSARGSLDRLMVSIGAGVGETPELTDPVPEPLEQPLGLAEAIRKALENRSELAVYDEQISTQQRKLAIASEDLKPGLAIETRFNSSESDRNVLSTSLFRQGYFDAALVYRHPIDKRIASQRRENESRELDVLTRMKEFQVEEIAEQVRRAYREMEAARTSLDINTRNLKAAEERLRLAERMVDEGEGTNREVLDAQSTLTQVRSGIISAKTNLFLATVNLKYYMGEDLTTLVAK